MITNKISTKELFSQQKGYGYSRNEGANSFSTQSTAYGSGNSGSQHEFSQILNPDSQAFSQNSNSQSPGKTMYGKYLSREPLFRKNSTGAVSCNKTALQKQPDFVQQIQEYKNIVKEREERNLLQNVVTVVTDCSEEVKKVMEYMVGEMRESVTRGDDKLRANLDSLLERVQTSCDQMLAVIQLRDQQSVQKEDAIEKLETTVKTALDKTETQVTDIITKSINEPVLEVLTKLIETRADIVTHINETEAGGREAIVGQIRESMTGMANVIKSLGDSLTAEMSQWKIDSKETQQQRTQLQSRQLDNMYSKISHEIQESVSAGVEHSLTAAKGHINETMRRHMLNTDSLLCRHRNDTERVVCVKMSEDLDRRFSVVLEKLREIDQHRGALIDKTDTENGDESVNPAERYTNTENHINNANTNLDTNRVMLSDFRECEGSSVSTDQIRNRRDYDHDFREPGVLPAREYSNNSRYHKYFVDRDHNMIDSTSSVRPLDAQRVRNDDTMQKIVTYDRLSVQRNKQGDNPSLQSASAELLQNQQNYRPHDSLTDVSHQSSNETALNHEQEHFDNNQRTYESRQNDNSTSYSKFNSRHPTSAQPNPIQPQPTGYTHRQNDQRTKKQTRDGLTVDITSGGRESNDRTPLHDPNVAQIPDSRRSTVSSHARTPYGSIAKSFITPIVASDDATNSRADNRANRRTAEKTYVVNTNLKSDDTETLPRGNNSYLGIDSLPVAVNSAAYQSWNYPPRTRIPDYNSNNTLQTLHGIARISDKTTCSLTTNNSITDNLYTVHDSNRVTNMTHNPRPDLSHQSVQLPGPQITSNNTDIHPNLIYPTIKSKLANTSTLVRHESVINAPPYRNNHPKYESQLIASSFTNFFSPPMSVFKNRGLHKKTDPSPVAMVLPIQHAKSSYGVLQQKRDSDQVDINEVLQSFGMKKTAQATEMTFQQPARRSKRLKTKLSGSISSNAVPFMVSNRRSKKPKPNPEQTTVISELVTKAVSHLNGSVTGKNANFSKRHIGVDKTLVESGKAKSNYETTRPVKQICPIMMRCGQVTTAPCLGVQEDTNCCGEGSAYKTQSEVRSVERVVDHMTPTQPFLNYTTQCPAASLSTVKGIPHDRKKTLDPDWLIEAMKKDRNESAQSDDIVMRRKDEMKHSLEKVKKCHVLLKL